MAIQLWPIPFKRLNQNEMNLQNAARFCTFCTKWSTDVSFSSSMPIGRTINKSIFFPWNPPPWPASIYEDFLYLNNQFKNLALQQKHHIIIYMGLFFFLEIKSYQILCKKVTQCLFPLTITSLHLRRFENSPLHFILYTKTLWLAQKE